MVDTIEVIEQNDTIEVVETVVAEVIGGLPGLPDPQAAIDIAALSTNKLDKAAIVATAGTVVHTSRVTGDTNPRFAWYGDGRMEWGPGNTAWDVDLYRQSAGVLETSKQFRGMAPNGTTVALSASVTGSLFNRWVVYGDGKQEWGTGAARDTNLYRGNAGRLDTDGNFTASALTGGLTRIGGVGPGLAAGAIMGLAGDTSLYRVSAGVLGSNSNLQVAQGAVGTPSLSFVGDPDTGWWNNAANSLQAVAAGAARLTIVGTIVSTAPGTAIVSELTGANQVALGYVGSGVTGTGLVIGSAADTNLIRGGANILQTNDLFVADLGLQTPLVLNLTGAGAGTSYIQGFEQSAQPAAPAANGYRLFAEDNGAGKTRLMVRFATGAAQQIAIEP